MNKSITYNKVKYFSNKSEEPLNQLRISFVVLCITKMFFQELL